MPSRFRLRVVFTQGFKGTYLPSTAPVKMPANIIVPIRGTGYAGNAVTPSIRSPTFKTGVQTKRLEGIYTGKWV